MSTRSGSRGSAASTRSRTPWRPVAIRERVDEQPVTSRDGRLHARPLDGDARLPRPPEPRASLVERSPAKRCAGSGRDHVRASATVVVNAARSSPFIGSRNWTDYPRGGSVRQRRRPHPARRAHRGGSTLPSRDWEVPSMTHAMGHGCGFCSDTSSDSPMPWVSPLRDPGTCRTAAPGWAPPSSCDIGSRQAGRRVVAGPFVPFQAASIWSMRASSFFASSRSTVRFTSDACLAAFQQVSWMSGNFSRCSGLK